MIRLEAFTPPLLNQTTGPFLRPASPKLPPARPLVEERKAPAKYQTLPYGIAAVPAAPRSGKAQIIEEPAQNESLETNTRMVETQRFMAFEPPRSATESAESELPVRASVPRYLPVGIASVGLLAACLYFFLG